VCQNANQTQAVTSAQSENMKRGEMRYYILSDADLAARSQLKIDIGRN